MTAETAFTGPDVSTIAYIIVGVITALAIIAVAFITNHMTKKQLESERYKHIASKRVEWLEEFRSTISDFLGSISMFYDTGKDDSKKESYREIIRRSEARVSIMLKPYTTKERKSHETCLFKENNSDADFSCPYIKVSKNGSGSSSVVDFEEAKTEAENAEAILPCCMHYLTRRVDLKENGGSSDDKIQPWEHNPKFYEACYIGVQNLTKSIQKYEWEKVKREEEYEKSCKKKQKRKA